MHNFPSRGFMLIISSPSGCGKTTITKALMSEMTGLKFSISATTRSPRLGEVDKKDYFFMEEETFKIARSENLFLEHAKVFGKYYGTPKNYVEQQLDAGYDVLFDIDWQGTIQLTQNIRNDVVSIFILPPSIKELENRLRMRNVDNEEQIKYRMHRAKYEISHWYGYDYVFINDSLQTSIDTVKAIVTAERKKRIRQQYLPEFIENLFADDMED